MAVDPSKRRVFLEEAGRAFQVFSLTQGRDGSIYLGSPGFEKSRWLELSVDANSPMIKVAPAPGVGKLSIHASGLAGVRANASPDGHKIFVKGSPLVAGNVHSVRHLTTVLPSEPNHVPMSAAGDRASDAVLRSSRKVGPFAFIFFAVPRTTGITSVSFKMAFHENVMAVPPDVSWGEITLPLHSLVWVVYSTRQMTMWPAEYHYCFHDGHLVPLFMGGGPEKWTFCGVSPAYAIVGSELGISLDASSFDGGDK